MDNELNKKLLDILSCMPCEGPVLDYKLEPYDAGHKAEFIKDVCAFLNSTEGYGKDKFIIIGVVDKTKYRKGLNKGIMQDDNYYQQLCQIIQPSPHVETGEIFYDEKIFGYIYISKDNTDRVYSIIKDFPEETISVQDEKNNIMKKVYASTAYIRKGSTKYSLNEYDRRRIYEQDKEIQRIDKSGFEGYTSPLIDEKKDVMKMCALIGTWNEKSQEEKEVISTLVGEVYEVWIKNLRELLEQKSEYVTYKNDCWQINKRKELIERYSNNYFSCDIKKFEKLSLDIMKEQDPKFDLKPQERYLISEKTKYSKHIKKGVLESFAILRSLGDKLINCEEQVSEACMVIVQQLLSEADWKRFASIDELLPIVAEINEKEYIKCIDNFIGTKLIQLKKLVEEQDEFVIIQKYTSGLYGSLELLAWNPIYLMQVFEILSEISMYDKKAIEIMSRILLPWFPQTQANIALRKATLEMVLNEYEDIGWDLLMQLMPKYQTISFPNYKPRWNNIVDDENSKVTNKAVYEQYRDFIKLAVDYSKDIPERIIKLIDVMDNVPEELFELISGKLLSREVLVLTDEKKYIIWNKIEETIAKHKRYRNAKWALPVNKISDLENLSIKIKPSKEKICFKRFFDVNYWDLYEEKENYDEQNHKLLLKQVDCLMKILKGGINNVISFGKSVKNAYKVGLALAEIELCVKDEKEIIELLNGVDYTLAQGYVKEKFLKGGFIWLNSINIDSLTLDGKIRLLIQLPSNKKVWDKVKIILKDDELEFWKHIDMRSVEDGNEYNYPIEKLLESNRPIKAMELINMALYEKKSFNRLLSEKTLKSILNCQENVNNIDIYGIKMIIKDLQDKNYNKDELFRIEWAYLPLLSYDEEYRPITIEKRLSEDPDVYMDVICLAYKAHSDESNKQNDNEKLAANAYRLLSIWRTVPGSNSLGLIDKEKIDKWLARVKKIAKEKDRFEVALHCFGKVLIYSPVDVDGFWIDRSVATILNEKDANEIRKGYLINAFNSVGVVNLDKEGTAWIELGEKWKERADETQIKYHRFASELRNLANEFFSQADYQKKHYDF